MKDHCGPGDYADLINALKALETDEEYSAFISDAFTPGELSAIAQRLEVARMLRAGVTYEEITQSTGASTATISRVNRCLKYGAGGYAVVFERLKT